MSADPVEAALLTLAEQRDLIDGLRADVDELQAETHGYGPVAAPRFWLIEGDERAAAIARLAAWVEQVFRPCYGHLASSLAPCWPQHPLALMTLDWLSELWSVLYLTDRRSASVLSGQAEWTSRLLPAAAETLRHETTSCQHGRPAGIAL